MNTKDTADKIEKTILTQIQRIRQTADTLDRRLLSHDLVNELRSIADKLDEELLINESKKAPIFTICHEEDFNLLWSNEHGWVEDVSLASTFTREEQQRYNLPMKGKWV
jgi:hypothetical protein